MPAAGQRSKQQQQRKKRRAKNIDSSSVLIQPLRRTVVEADLGLIDRRAAFHGAPPSRVSQRVKGWQRKLMAKENGANVRPVAQCRDVPGASCYRSARLTIHKGDIYTRILYDFGSLVLGALGLQRGMCAAVSNRFPPGVAQDNGHVITPQHGLRRYVHVPRLPIGCLINFCPFFAPAQGSWNSWNCSRSERRRSAQAEGSGV